jgi:peptidoglycan/xylan/chitin deacetylase (PgdA/CDA1 family)
MTRGAITLTFDDGYQHILDNIVPLLNQHKIPGVFAIPLDTDTVAQTEELSIAPLEKWLALQHTHHELAAHSVTHRNLVQLSPLDLEKELKTPQQQLNATTLIYPGGAYNKETVTFAQQHYLAARTVEYGFEKLTPDKPFQLKTYNFSRHNFSVTKANLLATYAWLTNSWLIETYHVISDIPTGKTHEIPLAGFLKHLKFIQRLPIKTTTIREQIKHISSHV